MGIILKLKTTKGCNAVPNEGQVIVLNLCTSSDHALYLYHFGKISQNVSELLRGHEKFTKENNFVKNVGRETVLIFCTSSDKTLYFEELSGKYLLRFKSYSANTIFKLKNAKGYNSSKILSCVMILNPCILSDHASYLYQVS